MKSSKPPAVATWLLEHIRFSATDAALAGDLLEEFNQRRSAAWYWRQVLAAIVAGFLSEVRRHRMLAIRAILVTWAANHGALMLGRMVMIELFRNRLQAYHPLLAAWAICVLGGAVSGFIVASLHRKYRNAMLMTGAGALLVWALLAILLLKKDALQHSFLQIAVTAIIYYVVAAAGFVIGGLLGPAAATAEAIVP